MRVLFMGSADFGIPSLRELLSSEHELVGIVTTPAKPKGRGLKVIESPIAEFALDHNINNIFKPKLLNDIEFINSIKKLNADIFVVIAFRILPPSVFMLPKYGTINVHASLLPAYRGAAPIHRAIEAGESISGVTVFQIDEGIDTGKIISQKSVNIGDSETTPELYDRLSKLGSSVLLESLENIANGTFSYLEQKHTVSTKAPKLSKKEAKINWNISAQKIFNRIRAFKPFPGNYCFYKNKRLGIDWAEVQDSKSHGVPGMITSVTSDFFEVQCATGVLRILRVKPEGKKLMDVRSFICGTDIKKGTILE